MTFSPLASPVSAGSWKASPPTGLVSGSVVRGPVAPDPDRVNCCRSLDNTVSASGLRLLGSKVEER